jgi:molecular chaperone DnaK
MYKATQDQQAADGGDAQANPEGGSDDVTDVDFEEVKEDK